LILAASTTNTTVFAAFAVGVVSFVSPCVLPLVPGYLSAVSGVSLAEIRSGERSLAKLLIPSFIFCLSFTVMFVLLGMSATKLGSTLSDHRLTLNRISGVLIIALGAFFVLTPFIPALNKEWRPEVLMRRAGTGGPIVAGLAFDRATEAFRWMRDRYIALTVISGVILIVMGVLLLTNEYSWLNARAQDGLNALHLDFFKSL